MPKSKPHTPRFTITPAIIKLVAQVSEQIGRVSTHPEYVKALRLNRINQIKSIHGSLVANLDIEPVESGIQMIDDKKTPLIFQSVALNNLRCGRVDRSVLTVVIGQCCKQLRSQC